MVGKDATKGYVPKGLKEKNQQTASVNTNMSRDKEDRAAVQKEDSAQILVVDDAEVDLELLTNILITGGYKVCSASNGPMALKSAAVHEPELILLDIRMPGMDGYEVCRFLKTEGKSRNVPVIFISALDGYEDRVEGFQAGGVDYITKPFQPVEILARVKTHLALRSAQKKFEVHNAQLQKEVAERMRAEAALQHANDNLERLVRERTEELLKINRQMVEEIEERKRVEDQLRSSENKYRYIFENIQDIYYEISLDGIIQEISPSIERRTKYTRDELIGKSVYEIYAYREERDTFLKTIEKTGIVTDHEVKMKDKDGNIRTVSLCSRIIYDENRVPQMIVGSMRDITERKMTEDALRESEKRFSDIIDFLPDAMFAVDRSGKIIAWNRAMEEMTGKKAENMLGKSNYEYSIPFYGIRRPILIDMVFTFDEEIEKKYRIFKKEGDILLAEGKVMLKGESRALWAKASPLYDSGGNVVGAIESLCDMTERKRAEKALKKRERELEIKSRNLEELNTALKVLLKQREADKEELAERTLSNVKHLILPYIEKLKKSSLEAKHEAYIGIVESNLKDIVSPFSQRLSSKYMTLTPKELQVANLIKEGKTTKEIAELMNASPGTIDFHRNNIRKKLNLRNKRANLKSYLLTLS